MLTKKEFAAAVFRLLHTGVLEDEVPRTNRTLDITNETMLAQRRAKKRARLLQHNHGGPIRNAHQER